jgi:hypothetical protein
MQDVFQCALSLGRKEEGRQGGNGRRGTNKNKVQALGAEGQDKGESTHHWLRGTAHTRLQAPYSHTITAQHLWN